MSTNHTLHESTFDFNNAIPRDGRPGDRHLVHLVDDPREIAPGDTLTVDEEVATNSRQYTAVVQWVSLQLPPIRLISFKVTHVDGVPV